MFRAFCFIKARKRVATVVRTCMECQRKSVAKMAVPPLTPMFFSSIPGKSLALDTYLPYLSFVWKTRPSSSLLDTPAFLTFGRDLSLPLQAALDGNAPAPESKIDFISRLQLARELSPYALDARRFEDKLSFDSTHRVQRHHFSLYDLVLLRSVPVGKFQKMQPKWNGPYRVIKLYQFSAIIEDLEAVWKTRKVSLRRLKPFFKDSCQEHEEKEAKQPEAAAAENQGYEESKDSEPETSDEKQQNEKEHREAEKNVLNSLLPQQDEKEETDKDEEPDEEDNFGKEALETSISAKILIPSVGDDSELKFDEVGLPVPPRPFPLETLKSGWYHVEELLDRKVISRRGVKTKFYLVKWRGFDESFNSWEPRNKLIGSCRELLALEDAKHPTPRRKRRTY
jgi:hypothetical protein